MLVRQRWFQILALLLTLSLLLTACEMPLPGNNDPDTPTSGEVDATPDANVGGGEPGDSDTAVEPETQPETAPDPSDGDTPRLQEEATATPEPEPEPTETAEATDEEAADAESTTEDGAETDSETEAETVEAPTPAAAQTHTVAAGENLYRIGLKFGVSWVTLAAYNNLPNANAIKVGQILNIPGEGTLEVEPTPSPLTETTHIVKAGDNLFRIGLKYGIAWTQIAEANGIVNPTQLKVGQALKIPVEAPDPTPQTTHLVQSGETLFLISLKYGLAWTAVAEANDISSPYVIYPGQTLVIPGE